MKLFIEIIKIPIISITSVIILIGILFMIFGVMDIPSAPSQEIYKEYALKQGGVFKAYIHYIKGYLTLKHFELNIISYRADKGYFGLHLWNTLKLVLLCMLIVVTATITLSMYRIRGNRRSNKIGSALSNLSVIHTLIYLTIFMLVTKQLELPMWIAVIIMVLSNNVFHEFYGDINLELDRIFSEKYVLRGKAWGYSRYQFALQDIIISFSRLITSKFPLILSSTFIIEYYSPIHHGLSRDLQIAVRDLDFFLIMSVSGVMVFAATFMYILGQLPGLIDPRQ